MFLVEIPLIYLSELHALTSARAIHEAIVDSNSSERIGLPHSPESFQLPHTGIPLLHTGHVIPEIPHMQNCMRKPVFFEQFHDA